MPESSPEERWLDDQLAEFTDRLLGEEPGIQPSAADPELRALQEIVIRLKRQLTDSQIDQRVVRQLRAQIISEWQRRNWESPDYVEHRHVLSERLKERLACLSRRRFRPVWGLGLLVTIIIVLLVVFTPQTASSSSTWLGTALGSPVFWPLAFLAIALLLAGAFWLWRSRR